MSAELQIEKWPANVDAERIVLGAILLENEAFYRAGSCLVPEDFSLDSHRRIYSRISELMDAGTPVDIVTLTEQLAQKREIEAVGGVEYISALTTGLPRRMSVEQYAGIIKGKSQLRQLIVLCSNLSAKASDQEESANAILADAHAELVNILAKSQRENAAEYLIQFTDRAWQRLQELKTRVGLVGLSLGIDSADAKTGGIRPSEFWLLGARTSDGKTVIAVQCAIANAIRFLEEGSDKTVGFFAIEMSKEQVLERIWAQLCPIQQAFKKIRDPRMLSAEEERILERTKNEAAKLPIVIEDSDSVDIREFDARARLLVHRENCQLVIVDHIHEMTANHVKGDVRHRFTAIAEGLRRFKKSTKVPVLGLAQVPKPDKKNINRRPTKHDYRESGALEEKCDVGMMIFRELDQNDLPTGNDELIIAKQRNGPIGICPIRLDRSCLRYEERA